MANVNVSRPRGFSPVKSMSGAPYNGLVRFYSADITTRAADTTNNHGAIFRGDPVQLNAAGFIQVANNAVSAATAILGVCVAVGTSKGTYPDLTNITAYFNPDNLGVSYAPTTLPGAAGTNWVIGVAPAENNLFQVQLTPTGAVPGINYVFSLVAATAHGDVGTGLSNVVLSAVGASLALSDCKVVELIFTPDNFYEVANSKALVKFNHIVNTSAA